MSNIQTVQTTNSGQQRQSLVNRFAERYHVDPSKLLGTLKATAFRQRGDTEVTNEQMAALLIVADQYKLNPFTKEIFAFNDKGAVVPVVSVDGWSRIINEHPAFDGMEFHYSEEVVQIAGAKPCPAWCEVWIYRKDRSRPTVVREYLDEVYQPPRGKDGGYAGPWQSHTKRFLRHKTLIQGSRIAFGFAGIYDEDEANRIVEAQRTAPVSQNTVIDAGPALTEDRTDQELRKPSRLAGIVRNSRTPEAVPAEGLPADQAPADDGSTFGDDTSRLEAAE